MVSGLPESRAECNPLKPETKNLKPETGETSLGWNSAHPGLIFIGYGLKISTPRAENQPRAAENQPIKSGIQPRKTGVENGGRDE